MHRVGSYSSATAQQQQVQDVLLLAHTQREQRVVPRVDSVRCTRSAVTSVEITLLCAHPESVVGCEQAITLALRLPDGYPLERPMIACVSGGEFLPPSLSEDGQLSLPWLSGGWPQSYTLVSLVQDVCLRLSLRVGGDSLAELEVASSPSTVASPRPSSPPLLLLMDSPPKRLSPLAPTYRGDTNDDYSVMVAVTTPPPTSPTRSTLTFKCKWRESQCQFQASPPLSLAGVFALLCQYIPSLTTQRRRPQLVEFNSSSGGKLLATDQQWHALRHRGESTIYILINESPSPMTPEMASVDLLGLHDDGAPVQLVHPLHPPPSPSPAPSPSKAVARGPVSPGKYKNQHKDDDAELRNVRRIQWAELQIGKIVGNGSSCRVYNATWRGTDVAVKVFTGTNRSLVEKEFGNEVSTMARLGAHPSLVLFLAVTQQPLSIIFEYLPFSLFELINGVEDKTRKLPSFPTSWTKRVTMMLDVAKGLQFLHSFDIIHRDMKSLNLLVTPEGRVKLADFGISRVAQPSSVMTGCCGTFQWMAPEVLQSAAYSVSADIYSFGIIMWEICEAAPPFADLAPALVPAAVLRDKKRPPFSSRTPGPLQELAQRCWHEDAAKRPNATEIAATLNGFFHQT